VQSNHNDEKIASLVKGFFQKFHADDFLQNLFKDHDSERYQHHPETFYAHSFGDHQYSTEEIAKAHKNLSVSEEHFESMVNHFVSTLDENGYGAEEQTRVREVLNGYKKEVVGRSS
jgi:hemoglobin